MAKIIYLISVLNNLNVLLFVLILAGVIALVGIAFRADDYPISEEEKKKLARYGKSVNHDECQFNFIDNDTEQKRNVCYVPPKGLRAR